MRSASIFLRKKDLLIHAQSQTTTGAWILVSPVTRLDAACPNDILGAAALAVLRSSRTGVPHPKVFTGLADPLFKAAKVKDWATFVKAARCARLNEDGGVISVTPMRNLGARQGFEEDPRFTSIPADSTTPEGLGAAVRAALATSS